MLTIFLKKKPQFPEAFSGLGIGKIFNPNAIPIHQT